MKQYFKSFANKSNSQEHPFLHSLQYDPKEVSFNKLNFFGFRLADDKNALMLSTTIIFAFLCSHYGFLYYFEMLSFLSSNNTPGRVSPYQISSSFDMYFKQNSKNHNFQFFIHFLELLWSKTWNQFPAEVIPWSPMFLDVLAVFHVAWKNQESCEF